MRYDHRNDESMVDGLCFPEPQPYATINQLPFGFNKARKRPQGSRVTFASPSAEGDSETQEVTVDLGAAEEISTAVSISAGW